jgi:hypothetical protein
MKENGGTAPTILNLTLVAVNDQLQVPEALPPTGGKHITAEK